MLYSIFSNAVASYNNFFRKLEITIKIGETRMYQLCRYVLAPLEGLIDLTTQGVNYFFVPEEK